MMVLWFVLYFVALVCCCTLAGATRVMLPQRVGVECASPTMLPRSAATERIVGSASPFEG